MKIIIISIDLRVNIFKDKIPIFIDYEKKQVINFQKVNLKFFEKRKIYSFSRCFWKIIIKYNKYYFD